MNHTVELLEKIEKAFREGTLTQEQIPFDAIREAVSTEIGLNRNTFQREQYECVVTRWNKICDDFVASGADKTKLLLFLDAAILCIHMISELMKTLANGDYWRYKYRQRADDPEIAEIIEYIDRKKKIQLLNYDFTEKYQPDNVEVLYDAESAMSYVIYKERKMYFPRGWDRDKIADYFCSVVMEQDLYSPHCYYKSGYEVKEGDVVLDAGAAEGIFCFDVMDRAEQIILVEADPQWVEALRKSFEGETSKVIIVQGYLSDRNEGEYISIDGLIEGKTLNYIKMDIEGYEKIALTGAERTLQKNEKICCAICSYHCKEDEEWIKKFLNEQGMNTDTSRGYICPDWIPEEYINAELRRGIVFGRKG